MSLARLLSRLPPLTGWFIAALILRLMMARETGFTGDIDSFRAWTAAVVEHGLSGFYGAIWCDYPPLFIALLRLWGGLTQLVTGSGTPSTLSMKLPFVLVELFNGVLIGWLLRRTGVGPSVVRRATLAYLFNPAILYGTAVWGQADSLTVCGALLLLVALHDRRLIASACIVAAAVLVKPQGLFLLPLAVAALWHATPGRRWPLAVATGLVTVWLAVLTVIWPLNEPMEPFQWLTERMSSTGNGYPYTSVNAFNLWLLVPPNASWQPDDARWLGLSLGGWGIGLMAMLCSWIGWIVYRDRTALADRFPLLTAAGATLLIGGALLPTRMHERYILPGLALLAVAQALDRRYRWVFRGFTITTLTSLVFVLNSYNTAAPWVDQMKRFADAGLLLGPFRLHPIFWLSLTNMVLFGRLIGLTASPARLRPEPMVPRWIAHLRALSIERSADDPTTWRDAAVLGGIVSLFTVFAGWRLGRPTEQVFDEVYHARAGLEYLAGTMPTEWTHPPLAKLLIALSLKLNGAPVDLTATSWTEATVAAWRLPSLLAGIGVLVGIYLLGRRMFGSRSVAGLATGLLALDGVFLVQSRIAMTNQIALLCTMLAVLGIWTAMQRNRVTPMVGAGLALGLGLATRWSTLYVWGLLGLFLVAHRWFAAGRPTTWRDLRPQLGWLVTVALTLVGLPVLVYLLAYIPNVLLTGGPAGLTSWDGGWRDVFVLQGEMYRYHAHEASTHPYGSPWWSWPLMMRPTWYAFESLPGARVAGVWAIGNAMLWWTAVPTLLYAGWIGRRDRDSRWLLIAVMGLGLWLIWGVQPRGLVFMHYMLDTIPFACLAMAAVLHALWRRRDSSNDSVRDRRLLVTGLLALAVGWLIFYYPLLVGLPIPEGFYRLHLWVHALWV